MLDGTFYFNDPFGTNNNQVKRAECFFYEWNGVEFVQAQVGWTDSNGYFYFWTDKDTVRVDIISSHEQSFVFFANDNCFNSSMGEQLYYYQHLVIANNPAHGSETIPVYYTTIRDTSKAGAFHIQNIIKHAKTEIDYPNFYPRVPIYYNNIDSCVTQSDFYGYTIADIPGIRIRGDVGNNDWDQWDTAVVLHELGHFYQHDVAQMSPNSAGSHVFYAPPSGSNINDLSLAWDEGWAWFFASKIINSPTLTNYGNTIPVIRYRLNLERPAPDVPYYLYYDQTSPSASIPYYEGAHVEGSVALSLWDLYDAIDDGNYLVSSQIWGHNNDNNASEWWQGWDPIIDVFANYDPQPSNPDHDYCWNIYEFINGWRTMGYPIDQTFIDIFEAHNVPVFLPGDADDNDYVNISDVVYIINYKYKSGPAPNNPSSADVQADCVVNLLDVIYLIDFKYKGGADLMAGCVNLYPN